MRRTRKMITIKKGLLAIVIFALISCLALVMFACGDEDDGDPTSPDSPSTPGTGTQPPLVTGPTPEPLGITITTPNDQFARGGYYQFQAVVWGRNMANRPDYQNVVWSVSPDSTSGIPYGTTAISSGGLLHVDSSDPATLLVVRAEVALARSVFNTFNMHTGTVHVPVGRPAITTPSYVIPGDINQVCTATVPGSPSDPGVTWRIVTGYNAAGNPQSVSGATSITTNATNNTGLLTIDPNELLLKEIEVEAIPNEDSTLYARKRIRLYNISSVDIVQVLAPSSGGAAPTLVAPNPSYVAPKLTGTGNVAVGTVNSVYARVQRAITTVTPAVVATTVSTVTPANPLGGPSNNETIGSIMLQVNGVGNVNLVANTFAWTIDTSTPASAAGLTITGSTNGAVLAVPPNVTAVKIKATSNEDTTIFGEQDITLYEITGLNVRAPATLTVGSSSLPVTSPVAISSPLTGSIPDIRGTNVTNLPAEFTSLNWAVSGATGATIASTTTGTVYGTPAGTGPVYGAELTLPDTVTTTPAQVQATFRNTVSSPGLSIGTVGTTPTASAYPGWANIAVLPVVTEFTVNPNPLYVMPGVAGALTATLTGYGPGMPPTLAWTRYVPLAPATPVTAISNASAGPGVATNITVSGTPAQIAAQVTAQGAPTGTVNITVTPSVTVVGAVVAPVYVWDWTSAADRFVITPSSGVQTGATDTIDRPGSGTLSRQLVFTVKSDAALHAPPPMPAIITGTPPATGDYIQLSAAAGALNAGAPGNTTNGLDTATGILYVPSGASTGTYTITAVIRLGGSTQTATLVETIR